MATIAPSREAGAPNPAAPMGTHPFTCVSCAVAFRSSELQRTHMRTDWHRYNLQRRIASLPPLSAETFTEKVLSAQATQSAVAARASFSKTCPACEKTYYSENAYINHLGSQKHKAKAEAFENGVKSETASVISSSISLGDPIEATKVAGGAEDDADLAKVIGNMKDTSLTDDSAGSHKPSRSQRTSTTDRPEQPLSQSSKPGQEEETMPLNRCMFCNYDSPNLKLNVLHMGKFHGMFVPEQDFLSDPKGLIEYLQQKVSANYECLLCHKLKYSLEAVQTHMRDKGHCMIAFDKEEELLEIGQFYDFRSTYSDAEDSDEETDSEEEETPKSSAKPGAKLGAVRPGTKDDRGDEEGEGWETDSEEEDDDEDISSLPVDQVKRRVKRSKDASRPSAYAFEDELYMPSGRVAGHRSLNKYWKQNPRSYLSPEEKAQKLLTEGNEVQPDEDEEGEKPSLNLSKYRPSDRQTLENLALAGQNQGNNQVALRQNIPHQALRAAVKKQRAQEIKASRQENRYKARIERANNSQKHFRDPLLQ